MADWFESAEDPQPSWATDTSRMRLYIGLLPPKRNRLGGAYMPFQ